MGFSAYILESLQRYGKAELGPLGTFILDYQPAHWNIAHQYFTPPQASIQWSPEEGTNSAKDALAASISRLHDTPKSHALEFIEHTLEKIKLELDQKQNVDLGILGQFSIHPHSGQLEFKQNPDLVTALRFAPLSLKPLPAEAINKEVPEWWIWLAILVIVIAFGWIVFIYTPSKPLEAARIKTEQFEPTLLKEINTAPLTIDTATLPQEFASPIPTVQQRIIITGTFCKPANIRKMREKIEYLQYQIYEEIINEDCVRLGIYLLAEDDLESSLDDIRKYIEPHAWVLN